MVHTSNKRPKGEKQQAQVFCAIFFFFLHYFHFFSSLPFINGTHKYWSHHANKTPWYSMLFYNHFYFFFSYSIYHLLSVDNCWKPVQTLLFIAWLFFILGLCCYCCHFFFLLLSIYWSKMIIALTLWKVCLRPRLVLPPTEFPNKSILIDRH